MSRILFPGALAATLLLPIGQATAHAPLESHPAPTIVLAQSAGHAADQEAKATFAVGDLVVEAPWARESVTRTGAVYLTVRNSGDRDDRLIGVGSAVAGKAELHRNEMKDGVMRMLPVEEVVVPAHGAVALEPGGHHVMLMGLTGPLQEGESFALVLEFEHAGKVEVMATIEDIAHGGPGGHTH